MISAGLVSLVVGAIAYVGTALAFTLATSNADAKAVASSAGYLLGAFGFPILAGVGLARSRGWTCLRVVRFAAVVSLLVHVALLPIALAAFTM